MNDLLDLVAHEGAEELRLDAGNPPIMGLHGRLRIIDRSPLTSDEVIALFRGIASEEQQRELGQCGNIHFTFASHHAERFAMSANLDGDLLKLRIKNLGR